MITLTSAVLFGTPELDKDGLPTGKVTSVMQPPIVTVHEVDAPTFADAVKKLANPYNKPIHHEVTVDRYSHNISKGYIVYYQNS